MTALGRLTRIADIRSVWPHEERDFSAWLAEEDNLSLLSETLGLGAGVLELDGVEAAVGGYRADIVCRYGMTDDDFVVIENQYGATDHDHLGKIATYAAGVTAKTVVWVAERFRDEHRAALDWLNTISGEDHAFFGVEIQLWRIGDSPPAPRFNVVARPNRFARATAAAAREAGRSQTPRAMLQLRYWTAMSALMEERGEALRMGKPQAKMYVTFSIGCAGVHTAAVISTRDNWLQVEFYLKTEKAAPRFDWLLERRQQIEETFGAALDWQRLPEKTACRVAFRKPGVDPTDETDWPAQHAWLCDHLDRLHAAFQPHVKAMPRDLAPVEP